MRYPLSPCYTVPLLQVAVSAVVFQPNFTLLAINGHVPFGIIFFTALILICRGERARTFTFSYLCTIALPFELHPVGWLVLVTATIVFFSAQQGPAHILY